MVNQDVHHDAHHHAKDIRKDLRKDIRKDLWKHLRAIFTKAARVGPLTNASPLNSGELADFGEFCEGLSKVFAEVFANVFANDFANVFAEKNAVNTYMHS